MSAGQNPFPGPTCYREGDRLLEREADTLAVLNALRAHRFVTLFGPSGAGKSSLLRAGVVPRLDGHRVCLLDVWPEGEAPLATLSRGLCAGLLGLDPSAAMGALPSPLETLRMVAAVESRPIVLVLDQIEQVVLAREPEVVAALISALGALEAEAPLGLHVILSIREDFFGVFSDAARDHPRLLRHTWRLRPLRVGAMIDVVLETAAGGVPTRSWRRDDVAAMVRALSPSRRGAPDDRPVEAALVQICFREIWDRERVAGRTMSWAELVESLGVDTQALLPGHDLSFTARMILGGKLGRRGFQVLLDRPGGKSGGGRFATLSADAQRDELGVRLLAAHLQKTLAAMEPAIQAELGALLRQRLASVEGVRRLIRQDEVLAGFSDGERGKRALETLVNARLLLKEGHGEETHYQLGHDWLAAMLSRQQRGVRVAERAQTAYVVLGLLYVLGLAVFGYVWTTQEGADMRATHERAVMRLAAAVERTTPNDPTTAAALLAEVLPEDRELFGRYESVAMGLLLSNVAQIRLEGHSGRVLDAQFSPDGEQIVTLDEAGTLRAFWARNGMPIAVSAPREGRPEPESLLFEATGGALWVSFRGGRVERYLLLRPRPGAPSVWAPARTVETTFKIPRLSRALNEDSVMVAAAEGLLEIPPQPASPRSIFMLPTGSNIGIHVSAAGVVVADFPAVHLFVGPTQRSLTLPGNVRGAMLSPNGATLALEEVGPDADEHWRAHLTVVYAVGPVSIHSPMHYYEDARILAVENDGRVVVAGIGGSVHRLDPANRATLKDLRYVADWNVAEATSATQTPQDRILLVGGSDGRVLSFDDGGGSLGKLLGHGAGPVRVMRRSPTEPVVLTVGSDSSPLLWRLPKATPWRVQSAEPASPLVGVTVAGERAALFFDREGALRLLEAEGGADVRVSKSDCTPHGLASGAGRVAWLCSTGRAANRLLTLDVGRDGPPLVIDLPSEPRNVSVCPDGATLLVGDDEGAVRVSLTAAGAPEVQRIAAPFPVHASVCGPPAAGVALVYSDDSWEIRPGPLVAPGVPSPERARGWVRLLGYSERLGTFNAVVPTGIGRYSRDERTGMPVHFATWDLGGPGATLAEIPEGEPGVGSQPTLFAGSSLGDYAFGQTESGPRTWGFGYRDAKARDGTSVVWLGQSKWAVSTREDIKIWDIGTENLAQKVSQLTTLCVSGSSYAHVLGLTDDEGRQHEAECRRKQQAEWDAEARAALAATR